MLYCNVLYVPPAIFGSGKVQGKKISAHAYKTDTLATTVKNSFPKYCLKQGLEGRLMKFEIVKNLHNLKKPLSFRVKT